MNFKKTISICVLIFLSLPAFGQTETRLLDGNIFQELIHEISGIRAKDYVVGISQYNRTEGGYENTGYEKAVKYVMSVLEGAGVEDTQLYTYLSDGTKTYGTWRSLPGFRVESAKLYLVKPFTSRWCDFSITPISLMPYSNGNGVDEAEVVYVKRGISDEDYEDIEVRGKIVFVDRSDAATVMRQAVIKRGALGIVMSSSGSERRAEFPTLVELNRLYLTGEETKTSKWGFSLSRVQTERLKNLLQSNREVVMRAEIFAKTFSGHVPIVSASISGSKYPEQEVIYMAHLDHYKPGANDNASGSAGLMEIAITLTKLIKSGRIPRPLRTLRFLWVPEWEGTAAFIENNREAVKKGIIGINMDMIGEDLQKCRTYMLITRPPLSRPSFLDALLEYYTKYVDELNITTRVGSNSKFNYRIIDYFGESDHMLFNDAQIGVPSTMIVHLTDRFWHTSFDTPDKVDPTELERAIFLGTFLGWTAANYDVDKISDMTELIFHTLTKKIESFALRYHARLKRSSKSALHKNYRNINVYFDLLHENGIRSLESTLKNVSEPVLNPSPISSSKGLLSKYIDLQKLRLKYLYTRLCREKEIDPHEAELSRLEKECSQIVPARLLDQSMDYWLASDIMRELKVHRFMNYDMFWEMLNYADGKNSLLKIRDAVSAQFREVDVKIVKILFEGLREKNYVQF